MTRMDALKTWVGGQFPGQTPVVEVASADASFRSYYRVRLADGSTRIVMDAPPEHEDCRPFIQVAGLLHAAGLQAPRIEAQELSQGFLLLSDLGTHTFLQDLLAKYPEDGAERRAYAHPYFMQAADALVQFQLASRPGVLPEYDGALLRRELDLFPEWFIKTHLQHELSEDQRRGLDSTFSLLIASALAQPKVFVHRDYMPRNLMMPIHGGGTFPGVLDFQDAVYGPMTYDIASLLRDAFISWDEEDVLDWCIRYWEKARKAGLPVREDFSEFYREFEWMGLQRHLKVLGIFCRLNYRDGKARYLEDLPRFLNYARKVAERYHGLGSLLRLLDVLENRQVQTGYTF